MKTFISNNIEWFVIGGVILAAIALYKANRALKGEFEITDKTE